MLSAVYSQSELLKEALQLADEIANNSISAVRESKRVIDMATLSSEANRLEEEANKTLRGSDEQVARFRAATKKVTGR